MEYAEWLLFVIPTYLLLFHDANPWLMISNYAGFFVLKGGRWLQRDDPVVPGWIFFLGFLILLLNLLGESILGLYYSVTSYDKILHFVYGGYLGLLFYRLFASATAWWSFDVLASVMGVATVWEMYEYFIDSVSGTTIMQGVVINLKNLTGSFEDTMIDQYWSLLGVLILIVVIAVHRVYARSRA